MSVREPDHVIGNLERGRFEPAYLIYGEESYWHERILSALRRLIVQPGLEDLQFLRFEGEGVSIQAAVDALNTMALVGRRLVVVEDPPLLAPSRGSGGEEAGEAESGRNEMEEKALLAYLERPNPESCLVLRVRGDVDRRRKVVKALEKQAAVVNAQPPRRERELEQWIRQESRRLGLRLDPDVPPLLAGRCEGNLQLLHSELEKLLAYAGQGRVTAAEAARLVSRSREEGIFDLVDAVATGQAARAMEGLRQLRSQGEAAMYILAMLARQVRLIWQAGAMDRQGVDRDEIPRRLKQHPYSVQKAISQAGRFDEEDLYRFLTAIYETERGIKSGRLDENLALELLVVEMLG